jgi:opacity protein-like surface antigen
MKRAITIAGILTCAAAMAAPAWAANKPWDGFYIGGNLGWTGDVGDLSFRDESLGQDLTFHGGDSGGGLLGGFHAGYGWSMNSNLYLGLESDIDFAEDIDYLGSVRGRLGYGGDRWLAYGTAGVAFGGGQGDFTVESASNGLTNYSRNRDKAGFVGGVGLEYAISSNVTIGAEALWYGLGSDSHRITTPFGETFRVEDKSDFGVIRARVTYYLGG